MAHLRRQMPVLAFRSATIASALPSTPTWAASRRPLKKRSNSVGSPLTTAPPAEPKCRCFPRGPRSSKPCGRIWQGDAPADEAGHPPSDRLKIGTVGPPVSTVGSPNIFVVDEIFATVEKCPDPRHTPRRKRGTGAQPTDQDGKAPGFLHRHSLAIPTLEMLAQRQVCCKVQRRPSFTKGCSVGPKLDQQVAQLATLRARRSAQPSQRSLDRGRVRVAHRR